MSTNAAELSGTVFFQSGWLPNYMQHPKLDELKLGIGPLCEQLPN